MMKRAPIAHVSRELAEAFGMVGMPNLVIEDRAPSVTALTFGFDKEIEPMKNKPVTQTEPASPQASHTPTPWVSIPRHIGAYSHVTDCGPAVYSRAEQEANAAFILRACNYNQVLINIAKNLHSVYQKECAKDCETCETIRNAEGI